MRERERAMDAEQGYPKVGKFVPKSLPVDPAVTSVSLSESQKLVIKCDLLHPLTTLRCKELEWTGPNFDPCSHGVLFGNRLYVGGDTHESAGFTEASILWSFSLDLTSCSPLYVPVEDFGLTTFNSKLVLVGGRDSCSQQISNKLWMSDDGKKWVEGGLPPMPTPRLVPFAASFGRPECIVVAGGITSKQRKSVSAEVLNDGQWSAVEPLPQCFTSGVWHFTLHNRNLYMCKAGQVLCCSLNTLISSSRTPTKSEVESHAPWRNINTPCDNLFLVSSKSKQLLAFSLSPDNSEVYAFSSYNQSWVHVGDSHPLLEGVRSHASMAVSVPTGDLMILRMDGYPETKAFKISANASPFSIDDQFTVSALHRLEAADVPIVSSLREHIPHALKMPNKEGLLEEQLEVWMKEWEEGSDSPPWTWRSLFDLLKKLDLEVLVREVEIYLTSIESLQSVCGSVITSAILEQNSLDPDLLPARLPNYVPTVLKRLISRNLLYMTM